MNNMTKDGAPLKVGIIYSDGARDSARLTWLIEEAHAGRQHLHATVKREYARQYIDLMMAQRRLVNADAERARWDAEQRNKWCEQMKAAVSWSTLTQKWDVFWFERAYVSMHVAHPDRDTAIDKARGVK
jgi:hypothetical protein